MYNHEPADYDCPFCRLLATDREDAAVVHRGERATAFISTRWWPRNPGHVLVIPNAHCENLYALPPEDGHAVFDLTQRVARAMRRSYGCEGVSTRQHNEPAGNQDVWHFHQHLFPRFVGDRLYESAPVTDHAPLEERAVYAGLLRTGLAEGGRRGAAVTRAGSH